MFVEVFANDERRRHVEETGADAVEEAGCEEHPLECADERRAEAAQRQHQCT